MGCRFTYWSECEQFHTMFLLRLLQTPQWAEAEIYFMGSEL